MNSHTNGRTKKWWPREDSNLRPLPCQGSALPTELRDHNHLRAEIIPKKTENATIFEKKELNEAY